MTICGSRVSLCYRFMLRGKLFLRLFANGNNLTFVHQTLAWNLREKKLTAIPSKNSKNYGSDVIHKITHSNPTLFQSYTFLILHSYNPTLLQSYTLPILHPSNPTLSILHPSNPTPSNFSLFQSYTLPILHFPILHSSNVTLFQSYTLPILHSPNPTLFQSYTLPILHSSNP